MPFFRVQKKIHWSDCDAAGIAWFPNYFGWFEDVEEELFVAALGRSRHDVLLEHQCGMPRVEAHIKYEAPVPIGTLLHIGVESRVENPRRLRHSFEMWDAGRRRRAASGFVRVACMRSMDFSPRDFPDVVYAFATRIQALAAAQDGSGDPLPWA